MAVKPHQQAFCYEDLDIAADKLTREFRLAAEYRRCGWYVLLCAIGSISVAAFLKQRALVPGNGGWNSFAVGATALILLAVGLLIFVYRWRITVDELGLARRRFWTWDFWPWDEFASGSITRRCNNFVSNSRPWWCKRLDFSLLNEHDREFALAACKFFFRAPEDRGSEPPTGEVAIRFQLWNSVTFRENGVSVRGSYGRFELDWSQVSEVRLLYFDHWSTELNKIELDLPDRSVRIEGINKVKSSTWGLQRVANPRVIPTVVADFLHAYVPSEKLLRHAIHGPPETIAEYEHRSRTLRREVRKLTWVRRTVPAGCLILIGLCFVPKLLAIWRGPAVLPNIQWAVLATALLVATIIAHPLMIWAFLHEIRKHKTKTLCVLEAWRNDDTRETRHSAH